MSKELTDEEIIDLYKEGKSLRDIAKILGRSIRRPNRVLKAAGIKMRTYGGSGPEHSQWTGGRIEAGGGYWKVWVPEDDPYAAMRNFNGYIKEHRYVMAKKLGRVLSELETVHHKDDDKGNNDPDNLQIRIGKHGKGISVCCAECGSTNILVTEI